MATKRMLIDASHPEETRVVVVNGNRLEDFDVEVESRKQLKGNIYLAKVTRVEPSLQAAFVDYGGNRHGFLAFSEIHPDYYQIPVADREALIAESAAEDAEDNDDDAANGEDGPVETLGGDDDDEVDSRRPHRQRRNYKIQEVIKRRQVLLIQVVKEERGNKGAALTTYLSLAGRYCVLMPNTARGGGISRKISSGTDRKRLKTIVNDLGIPQGMAVIVRTAGAKRSKAEIIRDYEYMIRLWGQVRDLTLESVAPCIVHEEGDLVKRTIRDLYSKEIDEVIVAGDDGYRMAKDFMKLLIPSHAKKVQPYTESNVPLMQRYGVENQLDVMHSPEVHLKSGGYIVINPTEALVSIDVNSGKATKERNIEETALKTNMEAAEEIARQLKLRDLAGLIVIDFIDMEISRNQTRVERQIKDAMRNDRARIQIGRISPFGLLELSRQRLRPSLIETSSEPCPHCEGTGIRRSTDSTALHMLRVIEEECMRRKASSHTIHVPTAVALYLLNHKRDALADIEARYETRIFMANDDTLIPPAHQFESSEDLKIVDTPKKSTHRNQSNANASPADQDDNEEGGKRRRRRRRGKRKRSDTANDGENTIEEAASSDADEQAQDDGSNVETVTGDEEAPTKRARRGRRGGRRRGRKSEDAVAADDTNTEDKVSENTGSDDEGTATGNAEIAASAEAETTSEAPATKPKRRRRKSKAATETVVEAVVDPVAETSDEPADKSANDKSDTDVSIAAEAVSSSPEATAEQVEESEPKKPARRRRRKTTKSDAAPEAEPETVAVTPAVDQASEQIADGATAEEKPVKRRRRTKAKAEPAPETPAATSDEPIIAAVVEDVKTPVPAPVAEDKAALKNTVAENAVDENAVDEKVVAEMAKTTVINIEAKEDDAPPSRKGWWRR
jgi:ribonuclease E